jgi:hypothetical protein
MVMRRFMSLLLAGLCGAAARLYVHGSDQPALLVSDLKHGESSGQVGPVAALIHAGAFSEPENHAGGVRRRCIPMS